MENESILIKKGAIKLAWYMRGGVSYEDVLNMSLMEREEIAKLIEENIDTTKKTGLSFF